MAKVLVSGVKDKELSAVNMISLLKNTHLYGITTYAGSFWTW